MSDKNAAETLKNMDKSNFFEPRNMAAPKAMPTMSPAAIEPGRAVGSQAAPSPMMKTHVSKPSRRTEENERQKKPYRWLFEFSTIVSIFRSHLVCHVPFSFIPGARCVTRKYAIVSEATPSMIPSTRFAVEPPNFFVCV